MRRLSADTDLFTRLIAAAVLAVVGLLLIDGAGGLPRMCPLVYPAPPACFDDGRPFAVDVGTATVWALLAVVVGVAGLALLGITLPRRIVITVVRVTGAALALSALAFPLWAAFSGGFGIDGAGLAFVGVAYVVVASLAVVVVRRPARLPSAGRESPHAM